MTKKEVNYIAPEGGWKNKTYYLVEASFFKGNPIHQYVLYTGFVDKRTGIPQGAQFCCLEETTHFTEPVYIKFLKELVTID